MNFTKTAIIVSVLVFLFPCMVFGKPVVLEATADIWLSDATDAERDASSGRAKKFKLKSIQEMAVIRFDTTAVAGYEILSGRLFFHPVRNRDRLKYIRVSTVTQTWEQGNTGKAYGRADGSWNSCMH